MLLDVYILKQGLLELPVLNTDPPVQASALYVKFVNKTILKIETILKLILTAKDPPAGLVQNYFVLIADKSVTNFLKVLELKVVTVLGRADSRVFVNSIRILSWNSSTR
jgi:vacuolar protein sorting-associated protein 53